MSLSTRGITLRTHRLWWRHAVEMVSSMRFAIALLTLICISSVIGTVIQQHQPYNNYVNQFGPFWAEIFAAAGLYTIYSTSWFLVILTFLVLSTSLCLARNVPKIARDLKTYKENIRPQSLRAFHHRAEVNLTDTAQQAAERMQSTLQGLGWRVKAQQRPEGWMLAAKNGAANKLGYIAAHGAIVLICVGGLLDGDFMVRSAMWLDNKTPYLGSGLVADVPKAHRLPDNNLAFRGNVWVPEGSQSNTALITQPQGVILQELPFSIELKKFIVEYYPTGSPKLFASEIVLHDKETGAQLPRRVEVNRPVRYKNIDIYQSSFDDGGSSVRLSALPLQGNLPAFEVQGTVGASSVLNQVPGQPTIEFTELRPINVENLGGATPSRSLQERMGAANKTQHQQHLRNVGPSISYKLRDNAGQAVEYHNYMLPVKTGDGPAVYLLGVRRSTSDNFQYLRLPVDAQGQLAGFVRLRTALANPQLREQAVTRYVDQATSANRLSTEAQQALRLSTQRVLDLFVGQDDAPPEQRGLGAIAEFLKNKIPADQQAQASKVFLRLLNGVLLEMVQLTQAQAKLPALANDATTQDFIAQSILGLSDLAFYPSPVAFELKDFSQLQASVFQVARAPGRNVVYLGCALLILGVFSMLYVRERRLWIWLTADANASAPGGTLAQMAYSTNRHTIDSDREFESLSTQLFGLGAANDPA